MPHVIVYELPKWPVCTQYERIKREIRAAVASVSELSLNSEHVTVTLVVGSGETSGELILVEIHKLYSREERTFEVRKKLAQAVSEKLLELNPECRKVECEIHPIDPEFNYWDFSKKETKKK